MRMSERKRGVMVVGLVLSALIADRAALAQARGLVESVTASEAEEGVTSVWIGVSARPTFTTWKLEQPARVVIDISGTRLGPVNVPFDAGTFAVGAVSAIASDGDGGARTRVVLTLRRAADYDVESSGNRITVRVRPHDRPAAPGGPEVARLKNEAATARQQAETRRGEANQARSEALDLAGKLSQERRALELERQKIKQAEQAAAEAARRLAAERTETERARAEADRLRAEAASAQKLAQKERAAAEVALASAQAAQKSAEERLRKGRAEHGLKLDSEMAQARAETERARGTADRATAEVARLAKERTALASLRAELDRRQQALASAETDVRRTQHQTDQLRQRMEEARSKEEARSGAARAAAERLAQQREQLDAKLTAQEEQRRRLTAAEQLVTQRDEAVKRAAQDLERREQASRAAAARLTGLARQVGATQAAKDEASAALAAAEAERTSAAQAAQRSRRELEQAVSNRRLEDERRSALELERKAEEQRLASAATRRADEESRLAQATEARRREERRMAEISATRDKLELDRARLEDERQKLVGELGRLRKTAAVALAPSAPSPRPPAAAPAPPPAPTVAAPAKVALADSPARAPAASPVLARPFSVTLRAPSRIQRIDFVDEPARASVIIDLDEPSSFRIQQTGGRRVSLHLFKTEVPRGLERSLDATEYLGPIRVISTYRDPAQRDAVRIDVDMAEDVPNTIRQDGSRLYWDFRKSPSSQSPWSESVRWPRKLAGYSNAGLAPIIEGSLLAQAAGSSGASVRTSANNKKRYTGRRIDLDFKGADIHNILRLLADVGVVNIVTSDDVKGEVTIKMRDVPWDQALDVVLRQKQLGQVREGNLIRVAPLAVLEKELEQEIARQKQITEVLPTETRLIGVSYADAKSLMDRGRDLLSPRGKISVDERTNTLIVSDVARNLALVEELIRNLDTQTSQVVIEARIVEARSTFVRQIGVQWGGTGFADTAHGNPTGLVFPHNIGIGGGATDGNTPLEGLVPGPRSGTAVASPNFAVNMPAAVGAGSRWRDRPDPGLGGGGLQPEPAALGHGIDGPGSHSFLATHLHSGQS